VAHCGIIIDTGSRDEEEDQHGMAHFIEHLIFKGTKKRKAHHILSRMEDVGGEINAYTTKEETCIFTAFFNNYYQRAFELMADLVFGSVFPEREIAREKEVIIDEINSYKDSPLELIFDDFEEQLLHPNPIARNILGSEEGLKSYERKDLLNFYSANYNTNEMVVSSAGSVPFKKVLEYFERYFSEYPAKERTKKRIRFNGSHYHAQRIEKEKNTFQCHCLIGNQAYDNCDDKRFTLYLLNNLLGGPGMNSRLNMNLRENKGLAYNVESNYNTYSDTGIVQIYFGTDKDDLKRCIDLTLRELKKLSTSALGSLQLSRAKRQMIGQIAISSENFENQMIGNGRSLLLFDRIEPLEEITSRIEAITASELLSVSNEVFNPQKLSLLIYK
jgi:predicted Zn-dependent peptidase